MRGRGFWRHETSKDICVLVLKIQYSGPRYRKVKVEWFYQSGRSLRIKETVKIQNDRLKEWLPFDPIELVY